MTKFRIFVLALTFPLLVITSCSNGKSSQVREKKNGKEKTEIIPVESVIVNRGVISSHLVFSSTVESEHNIDIFPKTTGIVEELYIEEGDTVKAGEPLAQLENDIQNLAVMRARQDYEQKKSQFKRVEDLYNRDLSSQQEYENVHFALEQAKLALEESKLNLEYTTIRSPIDGIITKREINIGDRISPSLPAFTIINPSELIVPVWIPEKEYANCVIGMKAFLESSIYPDIKFQGFIKRINPAIDPATGTFKVVIGIDDLSGKIRVGMFVNVYIIIDKHKNVPILPKDALIYDDERMFVFVVKDSMAIRKPVILGFEDAVRAEVLQGIQAGDTIITVGQSGLRDSSRVKITKLVSDG